MHTDAKGRQSSGEGPIELQRLALHTWLCDSRDPWQSIEAVRQLWQAPSQEGIRACSFPVIVYALDESNAKRFSEAAFKPSSESRRCRQSPQ